MSDKKMGFWEFCNENGLGLFLCFVVFCITFAPVIVAIFAPEQLKLFRGK